jgi:hypothetical protein
MSHWHLVEYKGVCCLVFPRVVSLIIHNILYKVFLNESFISIFVI